jgi:hypothetical protein
MCELQNPTENKIHYLNKSQSLVGYRGWYLRKDGLLYPLNQKTDTPLLPNKVNRAILVGEKISLNGMNGYYSYKNSNNYYYNYYHCNYFHYNYYYYYNSHCNYYIAANSIQYGSLVKHELGYRSTIIYPKTLVLLTPKDGLEDKFQKFLEDFNNKVKICAALYGCDVVNHVDWK